jgi:hypothetical protein
MTSNVRRRSDAVDREAAGLHFPGCWSPCKGSPGGIVPRASRGPLSKGPVIERPETDAMNQTRNQRAHRRHATAEPFPAWFKVIFALAVGGLALLAAVVVAALTVI